MIGNILSTGVLFCSIVSVLSLCDDPSTSWSCDNGECIDSEHLCNGKVDCRDHSDETALNCIGVFCPSYAFRCAYGACVAGTSKCNGYTDCADGSDETAGLCATPEAAIDYEIKLRGSCSAHQYQCGSGECIDSDMRCDGRPDCVDGSDETVKLCSVNFCPTYSFQCGYGACVRGSAKCDGIGDCVDSSDEAYVLCKTKRPLITPTKPVLSNGETCQVPLYVKNLRMLNRNLNLMLQPGDQVRVDTVVEFSCEPGLKRIGYEPRNACQPTGWQHDKWPACLKLCKINVLHGISTEADCYKNSARVNCNNELIPGSQAQIGCAIRFKKPQKFNSILTCNESGEWDRSRISCELDCGRLTAPTKALALNAIPIDITRVPWHVGIYSTYNRVSFNYTCGGTIISPNIVLSAAHCFWDDANQDFYSESMFLVAAGKYYRDFNNNEGSNHRSYNISKIHKLSYHHRANYHLNDLAVVILDQFIRFTDAISPLCLDFGTEDVPTGISGHFVGWGITEDRSPSNELRRADITTLSHNDCEKQIKPIQPSDSQYKLAEGSFCLHNDFGVSACRGDSGGGFVVAATDSDGQRFYRLLGIISHTPIRDEDCAAEGVVAMTNIRKYKDFIMTHINEEKARNLS